MLNRRKQPSSAAGAGEESHHDSFAESDAGRHVNWANGNPKDRPSAIPAQAEIQQARHGMSNWIPACAGMT
jgi:hypothetical protein